MRKEDRRENIKKEKGEIRGNIRQMEEYREEKRKKGREGKVGEEYKWGI